ncbi:MAG: His/Gly/Thr/Pro-type tRNA ligase C-terminal domain-containing protein, partial [Minisyncoccia bacterium]
YYGFRSFTSVAESNRGKKKAAALPLPVGLDPAAETVANFLRQLATMPVAPSAREPLFLWHSNLASGRAAPKSVVVQFHAIGADRAIADAVLIRAARALVQDLYRVEPEVRLNSMGDKETRARFARELGSFFRKRGASLPGECVESAKRDVLAGAQMLIERDFAEDLPSPTDHLSDASRKRFEELLEYLEATETPYSLAPELLSRGDAWSEMCFEIRIEGKVAAWGSRYLELAKHFFKIPPPSAAGVVLRIATGGGALPPAKNSRARFAFVHIGDEAKRASIMLAEDLKKARVPLAQMIGIESLSEQMRFAEALNPPYLLIMGRKEALEHSAILRNRETQEETILPLLGLSERLKAVA